MSIFTSRLFTSRPGLAWVLAALCLGGGTAHGQAAPVPYWIPGWVGFGGNPTVGQSSNTYGKFSSFDGSDAHTGYNFPNGWSVGGGGGGVGLSMNGISQDGAFGNIGSLYYQGVQFGYSFPIAGGLPLTVYAGFDTVKYNPGIGGLIAPFDALSSTQPVYGTHAGVEFKPTPNVSLSLGFGYTQQ
jgi:opacity protein-like surface antigen